MPNQSLNNLLKNPRTNWGYVLVVLIVAVVVGVGISVYAR